mgnify:CR=1 FL=1
MRTSEERMLAVEAWFTSGLTQNEYCKTLGVKRTTFANWVGDKQRQKVSGFVRLAAPEVAFPSLIEVIYPNGVTIKASSGDLKMVSQLIRLY